MSDPGTNNPINQQEGWRLLAYMAGDNDLSADMCWALQSMKEYVDDPRNANKEQLEVTVHYDPNGLEPRILNMSKPKTKPGPPAQVALSAADPNDGNLDSAVTGQINPEQMLQAVRDDLGPTTGQQPSEKARPNRAMATNGHQVVPKDLILFSFADLSTEAMLKEFIGEEMDGDSRLHMLVLSGHGNGVNGNFMIDEDPHSSLIVSRLGKMLGKASKGKKINILGMDSCLMGMAEVACEVRGHADFLVGSEGFVNNTGWPYHRVLDVLAGTLDPEKAATGIVEKYAAFYQDFEMSGSSTQIAALDLDPGKLDKLTGAVKKLAESLASALRSIAKNAEQKELDQESARNDIRDAVILAHWYAQSFKFGEYTDLWDFCNQLRRFLPEGTFKREIEDVQNAIEGEDGVVIRSCYCGPDFQHAHGVAIYFPWSAVAIPPSYGELKFAKATQWHEFLDEYLKKTRRMRRGDNGQPPIQTPLRFGPDVNEVTKLIGSLDTAYGVKSGSPFGSRSGSPFGSRSGSPFGSRSGSPFGSRMLGGTVFVPSNFQNVPDGYLRQDLKDQKVFTGKKEPDRATGDKKESDSVAAPK